MYDLVNGLIYCFDGNELILLSNIRNKSFQMCFQKYLALGQTERIKSVANFPLGFFILYNSTQSFMTFSQFSRVKHKFKNETKNCKTLKTTHD